MEVVEGNGILCLNDGLKYFSVNILFANNRFSFAKHDSMRSKFNKQAN